MMSNLLTQNSNALRLLMTEDLYILPEKEQVIPTKAEQAPEINSRKEADAPAKLISETPVEQAEEVLPQKPAEPEKIREFSYLGENNKYFLILFNEPNQKDISSIQKETLLKIMAAKGLELRDLAVLNLNRYPEVNYTDLKEFFSFNKIVLFGIDPHQISLSSQSSNQIVKLESAKILCTYSIDEMIKDTTKKREFWNVMKDF
ncbi:hypothetical protein [Daejeonella sp.]|uniref:hypothetical protein n=1 Tax=Daejeonella sp. TaxID=2805397 RepID=UPI0027321CAC|nr:hypothetical protein [Daejeonella sp.]MDP2413811.1 hypothetical protein [Daejeonella sp.]